MKTCRARTPLCKTFARWLACACGGIVLLAVSPAESAPPATPLQESALRVGMLQLAFINLNESDATAACQTFVIAIGRKRGYELRPEVLIYDALPRFEHAVRDGTIHVAIMNTWQLLESGLSDAVEIGFVPSANGVTARRLLLLARRDSGLHTPAALRDKSLLVLRDARTTLGRPWFDTICRTNHLGSAETFLRNFDIVTRPNAAILPVFFRRSDACIVDEQTFAVTCELNPQLSRDLIVIAQSEPMVDSVVCLNRTGWESARRRDDLQQGLAELHLEPGGRQILTLFHFDRLAPFRPTMLDTVADMHARYIRLQTEPGTPKLESPPAGVSSR